MDLAILPLELNDADVTSIMDVLFRWVHVVSAVVWIGLAYFLCWVLAPFTRKLTPDATRTITLGLLPRALFFYRFAALYTYAFGQVLLFNLYYTTGDYFYRPLTEFAGTRPSIGVWIQPFVLILIGTGLYELLFRTLGKRLPALATLCSAAALLGFAGYLIVVIELSHRAAFVHVAALLATAMVSNTWLHIWPAGSRVIQAHKENQPPIESDLALAAERGVHNVYMAAPVLLLMLSVHLSWLTGIQAWYATLSVVLLIGFAATRALFANADRLDEDQCSI